ncbi:MAG: ribbon-helix-helix protein, CopG family [Candidatus Bathyarchaeia archaeon]
MSVNVSKVLSRRKLTFCCYLTVDQMAGLEKLAQQKGRKKADLIREAIDLYLAQELRRGNKGKKRERPRKVE